MIEVTVESIRVSLINQQRLVVLRETGSPRFLPIWIGPFEAEAITLGLQGAEVPRPMTHDLLKDVIEALGHELVEVRIVALKDSVFHAALVFDGAVEVSARSSDAIALALRTGTTILVEDGLLDEAGVAIAHEEDDEVERFREFLDHVSAEDFEGPGEAGETEVWPSQD